MKSLQTLVQLILFILPWRFRRPLLGVILNIFCEPGSKIGFSIICANRVEVAKGARVGHLNYVAGLELLRVSEYASIGNLNWITGFPKSSSSVHFADDLDRDPSLLLSRHSAITNRHYIDCTNQVSLGAFSTVAGVRSQILTHSIDIHSNKQTSGAVEIGDYCFIGTGVIILKDVKVSDKIVIGAGSVVRGKLSDSLSVYGGIPAIPRRKLSQECKYFSRESGYVE